MKDDANPSQLMTDEPGREPVVRTLQLLQMGSLQFAVFADEIAMIARWREPTPLPHAPRAILGVVTLQGRMLTVLDVSLLSTQRSTASGDSPEHLIALRGDEQLALAVTAVAGTIDLNETEITALQTPSKPFTLGLLERDGVRIPIINPKEIFSTALQGRERRRCSF